MSLSSSARLSEPPGRSGRTRASKQNLVGVDIADAGDDSLVDQKGLERSAAAGQGGTEVGHIDFEGIRAEVVELGQAAGDNDVCATSARLLARAGARGGEEELPEGPGVDEPELICPIERHHGVGVRDQRVIRVGGQQLAAHPEMDDQDLAVVPFQQ